MKEIKMQFGSMEVNEAVENRLFDLGWGDTIALQNEINAVSGECFEGSPRVYVGTYGKYNAGSLRGLWVCITAFDDYDEFIKFCKAIHADEAEPELMFQDYENFPHQYYSECSLSEETFDNICEYELLCKQYEPEAINYFLDDMGRDISDFEECYQGCYASEEDFAREIVNDCYDLDIMMGDLSFYFDYDTFARDLLLCDYSYDCKTGAVFSNH